MENIIFTILALIVFLTLIESGWYLVLMSVSIFQNSNETEENYKE